MSFVEYGTHAAPTTLQKLCDYFLLGLFSVLLFVGFFLLHEKAFTEWTLKGELRLRGFVSHCTLFTESIISVM